MSKPVHRPAARRPHPIGVLRPLCLLGLGLGLVPSAAARPTDGDGLHPYEPEDVVDFYDTPEGLVRVHFSRSGPNMALLDDLDLDGLPDIVGLVGAEAEAALEGTVAAGFRLPVAESELGLGALGGSDALDVYLVDFAGVADGMFAVDGCRGGRCAGHLLVENDFAGYGYASVGEAAAVLASHELFHGVQYAYTTDMPVWMSEGSAVWAEHLYSPEVDDFLWFCGAYQDDMARPFDRPPAGVTTSASYGVGLVFAFFVELTDPSIMVELMEAMGSMGGDAALDALLMVTEAAGVGLAERWPELVDWSLATGRRAGLAPSFSFAAALGGVSSTVSGPVGEGEAALVVDERLYSLAAVYVRLDHRGGPMDIGVLDSDPGVWISVSRVAGGRTDGPVEPPLFAAEAAGDLRVALGDQPEGTYWMALSKAAIGEDSSRPQVCVGSPEAVDAACPVRPADPGGADGGGAGDGADGLDATDTGAAEGDVAKADPAGGCSAAGGRAGGWLALVGVAALLRPRRRALPGALNGKSALGAIVGALFSAACVPVDSPLRKGPGEGDGASDGADSGAAADAGGDGGSGDGGSGDSGGGGDSGADGADGGEPAPSLPEEVRGIWITRYVWTSEADLRRILVEVADAGFNAVFFQCRGTYDAYYQSNFEPWAQRLTGTLGADPGWDPLAVAVEVAHGRGMQLHAYMNAVPFWQGTVPPAESTPRHAYLEHPEWLVAPTSGVPMALNSSYVYASVGNAEVRQRIADVAADIADHYDVDGVHLDYIRYPAADTSHDAASVAAYAADDLGLGWADWQRAQLNQTVSDVKAGLRVPLTAAVWGIYENDFGWSGVSQGNVDYYQDSRAFTASAGVDAIMPMIYWPLTSTPGERLDFSTLVLDHVANNPPGTVVAGVGNTITFEQLVDCIRSARAAGARGVVVFDYSLFADRLGELGPVFAEAD